MQTRILIFLIMILRWTVLHQLWFIFLHNLTKLYTFSVVKDTKLEKDPCFVLNLVLQVTFLPDWNQALGASEVRGCISIDYHYEDFVLYDIVEVNINVWDAFSWNLVFTFVRHIIKIYQSHWIIICINDKKTFI